MGERSRLEATDEQRRALEGLARSGARGEADRARAALLSLDGQSSAAIGRVLRARADTVRAWRSSFARGGAQALRARPRPGRPGRRGAAALARAGAILAEPGEVVWTLPRPEAEITRQAGVAVSPSRLSRLLRRRGASPGAGPDTRSRDARTGTRSSASACGSAS
jgi:transposase